MSSRQNIGLTGGIACGKSTLAEGLRARGWHVIDTDRIAHRLMQPGEANWKNVVNAFGPSILQPDKSIDRKVLGRLVFADPCCGRNSTKSPTPPSDPSGNANARSRAQTIPTYFLAVMIPLPFECELEQMFSAVWCVGASRVTQMKPASKARGLSETEAAQRRPARCRWPRRWPVPRSPSGARGRPRRCCLN